MQRLLTDGGTLMKAVSVVLVILGVMGLVSGFTLAYNVERADDTPEGQAFLEDLRLQMAEQLGLPPEEPVPIEPAETTEPQGESEESALSQEQSPPEMTPGVALADVTAYFSFYAMLILFEGMVQLLAGIVGLLRHSRPDAQVLPLIMAISMLVVWVVRMFMGEGDLLSGVFMLVLPVLYLYASRVIRRGRRPALRGR